MGSKEKITYWYEQGRRDAPRVGYIRWTSFVDEELLKKFKEVAKSENKSFVDALNEALENWTNYTPE